MKENKEITVKVVPDPTVKISYPRIYSNYVAVQSTPSDFTLRFCDALPIFEKPEIKDGIVENRVPILAEIILPVSVFQNLIKVMTQQYEKYQEIYMEPKKDEKKK
jgi:hypothetical protein